MSALGSKLRSLEGGSVLFFCPGCKMPHHVRVSAPAPHSNWGYNGNPDAPTFTPSVLVRGVSIDGGDEEIERIIDSYKLPEEREAMLADKRINTVCHSFVTDGHIRFLGDCTHELVGQTVPMPDFPRGGQ